MLLEEGEYPCLWCLNERCASLRFDKRSRPYVVCRICTARTFIKTRASFLGLVVLPEFIKTMSVRAKNEPALVQQLQQKLDGFVADIQRRTAPAPAESQTTAQVADKAKERVA